MLNSNVNKNAHGTLLFSGDAMSRIKDAASLVKKERRLLLLEPTHGERKGDIRCRLSDCRRLLLPNRIIGVPPNTQDIDSEVVYQTTERQINVVEREKPSTASVTLLFCQRCIRYLTLFNVIIIYHCVTYMQIIQLPP